LVPPPIKLTATIYPVTEILLKEALNTITLTPDLISVDQSGFLTSKTVLVMIYPLIMF
jgi:hypothetical protein